MQETEQPQSAMQETEQPQSAMQETEQSQTIDEIDIDEIVRFLEDIWLQENEIRESISEAEWQEFIESVENSAQ